MDKRSSSSLVLLVLAAVVWSPALHAEGPTKPTLVAGEAQPKSGRLVAGPKGAEWALPGGPRLRAEPGAELNVLHRPQPLTLGPGATVPGYTVVLRSGRIDIDVGKGSKSAVIVSAPRKLSAIVKSGQTRLIAGGSETAIACDRGETTSALGDGAYRPLGAGFLQVVTSANTSTRPLVSPPGAIEGRRLIFAPSGSATLSDIAWKPSAGATSYRLELVKKDKTDPVASSVVQASKLERAVPGLAPGEYTLSIRSVDPTGLLSEPLSSPVRIIGAELAEGAYLDESGTIRLGQGQQARFVGVGGLEMTYGNAGRWVKAAQSAGLLRNEPTLVRFRLPGTTEMATARLAARTLRARIDLSPRTATWPRDSIDIRVRLEDPSGQVPSEVQMKTRVLLGVKEISVPFNEEGGWLRGRVPPRSGSGPWVLRVEVADQHGFELGRDFVEIVSDKTAPKKEKVSRR